MKYISENVKKQKEIGTVLGMIDKADCTMINKLCGRENVILYANDEYKHLFKAREIINAIKLKENLIITASGKREIEEIKKTVGEVNADIFSFSEKRNIEFNYQTLGSKQVLHKAISELEGYEQLNDGIEDEQECKPKESLVLSKTDNLPETLKSEKGIAIKEYFKIGEEKILIVDVQNAKEDAVAFLLNLLKTSCEDLDDNIQVTLIDDTQLLNKQLIHSNDKVRTLILTSEDNKEKVDGTIEIHVNEEYTVVLGNEWMLFKTPTAEEMKTI